MFKTILIANRGEIAWRVIKTARRDKTADKSGYRLVTRAAAGGGGKGRRVGRSKPDAAEVFKPGKAKAKSPCGDDRVLIENFIVDPRHIEIQVLGDKHGNVIY